MRWELGHGAGRGNNSSGSDPRSCADRAEPGPENIADTAEPGPENIAVREPFNFAVEEQTSPLKNSRTEEISSVLLENPSQGDNPNIALTRPQVIGPLTLVGQ